MNAIDSLITYHFPAGPSIHYLTSVLLLMVLEVLTNRAVFSTKTQTDMSLATLL